MPCVIRKVVDGQLTNHEELLPDEWRLRELVAALEAWLEAAPTRLDPTLPWVADIGFCVRSDATGGGPPISRRLMQLCLDSNLEILLSEYPGEA
jgi:hypothetical protein